MHSLQSVLPLWGCKACHSSLVRDAGIDKPASKSLQELSCAHTWRSAERTRAFVLPALQGCMSKQASLDRAAGAGSSESAAGPGGEVRGAVQVRARPDRRGQGRQAGPRDRAGRPDQALHPDPVAAHQEQPRAHRRAGRGQDSRGGGPRPAHLLRRRACCAPGKPPAACMRAAGAPDLHWGSQHQCNC